MHKEDITKRVDCFIEDIKKMMSDRRLWKDDIWRLPKSYYDKGRRQTATLHFVKN